MIYLKKELVVWSVEDILKVCKSDSVRTNRKFDEVWSVFIVYLCEFSSIGRAKMILRCFLREQLDLFLRP